MFKNCRSATNSERKWRLERSRQRFGAQGGELSECIELDSGLTPMRRGDLVAVTGDHKKPRPAAIVQTNAVLKRTFGNLSVDIRIGERSRFPRQLFRRMVRYPFHSGVLDRIRDR